MKNIISSNILFSFLFSYVVFELSNPYAAKILQLFPKVSNYMIIILFCLLIMPKPIKKLKIDVSLYYWSCSLLLFATINIPFVEHARVTTIKELIVAWFNLLILIPVVIKVLSFKDFRYLLVVIYNFSLIILSILWSFFILFGTQKIGGVPLTRSVISPIIIYGWPLIFSYFFITKNLKMKLFFLVGIILCTFTAFALAQRALWVILPIQFFLISFFILSKKNIFKVLISVSTVILFSLFLPNNPISNSNDSQYSDYMEDRIRNTTDVLEDGTLYVRLAMYIKTYEILKRYPFLGIGYSNNSFADFNAGYLMVGDREVIAGQIDAHNAYLNILGTTGLIGLTCAFIFFLKIGSLYKKIRYFNKGNLETTSFFISMIGVLLWMLISSIEWSVIVYYFCPAFSIYIYFNNLYNRTLSVFN